MLTNEPANTYPPSSFDDLARAAQAYRAALAVKEIATSVSAEFPKVAAALEAAARSLIAEGKKAEAK